MALSTLARSGRVGGRVVREARRQGVRAMASYNFATQDFHKFLKPTPGIDTDALRVETVKRMEAFNPQSWHDAPIRTVLNGQEIRDAGDHEVDTVDAFNTVNGKQTVSPGHVVDRIINHVQTYKAPTVDNREAIRKIEDIFFSGPLAADLVARQALDFHKQDGITEIEESVQALRVERNINDALFADELAGKVVIRRDVAFVGAVSNFTNFLDLCRKMIRNIELGVPVVVLSRSNTTQHMYRYTLELLDLMKEHGVDLGLVTYCSCSIEDQRRLLAASKGSPMYFTGSREVSTKIKEVMPKLMSSTGGPNTMVVGPGAFTPEVAEAARMSNMIEHKGQCTALRHLVVAKGSLDDLHAVYKSTPAPGTAKDSLRLKEFSAPLRELSKPVADGYSTIQAGDLEVAVRVNGAHPPAEINEQWREAYIDLTTPESLGDAELSELAAWLNREQPISLAMNCSTEASMKLFENTAMVVYTVGTLDKNAPALTCQARPQEGECFGEFPPRHMLDDVTYFPVVVPSSTPGYNTTYAPDHLKSLGSAATSSWGLSSSLEGALQLVEHCDTDEQKGYCRLLLEYLADATTGPHRGYGPRTPLFGLQRPPLEGGDCCVRLGDGASVSDAVRFILPFVATNARSQLTVSVPPSLSHAALAVMEQQGLTVVRESDDAFHSRSSNFWNAISLPLATPLDPEFPLAAHFVSRLFPLGHIKSVLPNDEAFVSTYAASAKWLRLA